MCFHFPLMPRLFMALKTGLRDSVVEIMGRTPTIPDTCQWCIFLRNHDELTLEMVTEQERQFMWEAYAPEPRMRLNLGIRAVWPRCWITTGANWELLNAILFTMPGSPILYYGDENRMGDNIWLARSQWCAHAHAMDRRPERRFFTAPRRRALRTAHRRSGIRLSARERRRAAGGARLFAQLGPGGRSVCAKLTPSSGGAIFAS